MQATVNKGNNTNSQNKNISTSAYQAGTLSTFLVSHFRNTGHESDAINIEILDHIKGNVNVKSKLREKKAFWIKLMVSAYPFSFNDQIKSYGNISDGLNPLEKNQHPYFCNSLSCKDRRNRGKKRRSRKYKDCTERLNNIVERLDDSSGHCLYTYFRTLNKYDVNRLIDFTFTPQFQGLSFSLKYKIYGLVASPY